MEHHDTIISQFTLQAVPFAELPGHSASMDMLVQFSGVGARDTVLDVACGPGIVACELAKHAAHVTGLDLTPTMIEEAGKRQQEQNLTNVSWHIGDVLPLPFPSAHFSCVVTRYSFHHFLDPMAVLLEMVRVCKPHGRVMVVDAVLPSEKIEAYNRMEQLRDPSHTKALSFAEMAIAIETSGLTNIKTGRYKVEMELERQLAASFPHPGDKDKLGRIFESDIGKDAMGVGVHRMGSEIHFAYPILITVGQKVA
ncbi:MAG: methyltransferase domain-containing protein [Nitrospirales bacterium]|nr:methyltransferase domain-containing protein [Nitrospirales bacterium]